MKKSWILLILIISAVKRAIVMRKLFLACLLLIVILSGCVSNNYKDGWNFYNQGQTEKAIQYFEETRDEHCPNCLCKIYSDIGEYAKAIKYCESAVVSWKSWTPTGYSDIDKMFGRDGLLMTEDKSFWVNSLVDAYSKTGQKERAIDTLKRYVTIDIPNNSNGFARLAGLYYDNEQHDEAITAGKRAIELNPDNAVAYNNLGAAYGMKKQYDEAIRALQKAIVIDPKMSGSYDWMGHFLMEKNAYNEAVEALKKSIEVAPSIASSHEALAKAYYKMGRYDDAIAAANRAIELQTIPGGIGISIDVKNGYPVVKGVVNNGPAKKAVIQAGDKIIEIDGKSTEGWNTEKVVQSIKGTVGTQVVLTIERNDNKIKKPVTREKIVLEGAASSIGIRSLIYRHKGDINKAFSDAEDASALNPSNDLARLSLGAAYLDRGQYDESIKQLSQIKYSSTARLLEATTYAKQGKMKLAVNFYFSIMDAYPEEAISPKNIPLMNDRMALLQTFKPFVKEHRDKARSFESKGQEKEALSELSEALKTADETEVQDIQETIFSMIRKNPLLAEVPEDARKYALRGEVLIKEGNFEQAATEFKKAIQIAPYAARLYYNSALINAELKKYHEAIRHMKIYVKAAPDAPDARAAKDEIIKWEFMMEKGK